MTAAEDMRAYVDMQIVGTHHTNGGVILELAVPGGYPARTFVTIRSAITVEDVPGFTPPGVVVTETVDPPAPRYRNRRGYTDAPTLAQHHIDQGDDRAEHDREQNDRCNP